MSIKKVSDLDSYLSTSIPEGNLEPFVLDNFKRSYFEISKNNDDDQSKYFSRNIDGSGMISAMHEGLKPYFADIGEISGFTKKLGAIFNLFRWTNNNEISAMVINNDITLSVINIIEGTARKALWG